MSSVVVGDRQSGQIAGGAVWFFRRSAPQTRSAESEMADDKGRIGGPDRLRVASGQEYEVRDFAEKFGISPGEARDLIERFGNDRETLEQEAKKLGGANDLL